MNYQNNHIEVGSCIPSKGSNYSVRKARYQNLFDIYEQEISQLESQVFTVSNSLFLARKELKEVKQKHSAEFEQLRKELWQVKSKSQTICYTANLDCEKLLAANKNLTAENKHLTSLVESLYNENKRLEQLKSNNLIETNDYIYLHNTPYVKSVRENFECDRGSQDAKALTQYSPESSTNEYDPLDEVDNVDTKFKGSMVQLNSLIEDQIAYLSKSSNKNDDYCNINNQREDMESESPAQLVNSNDNQDKNEQKSNKTCFKIRSREHSPSDQFFQYNEVISTELINPLKISSGVSEITKLMPVSSSITIKKKRSKKLGQLTRNTIRRLLHDRDNYRQKN